MANETNPGYLVQLQNPEGDNVYPVVSTQGIKNEDGSTFSPDDIAAKCKSYVSVTKPLLAGSVKAGDIVDYNDTNVIHETKTTYGQNTITNTPDSYANSADIRPIPLGDNKFFIAYQESSSSAITYSIREYTETSANMSFGGELKTLTSGTITPAKRTMKSFGAVIRCTPNGDIATTITHCVFPLHFVIQLTGDGSYPYTWFGILRINEDYTFNFVETSDTMYSGAQDYSNGFTTLPNNGLFWLYYSNKDDVYKYRYYQVNWDTLEVELKYDIALSQSSKYNSIASPYYDADSNKIFMWGHAGTRDSNHCPIAITIDASDLSHTPTVIRTDFDTWDSFRGYCADIQKVGISEYAFIGGTVISYGENIYPVKIKILDTGSVEAKIIHSVISTNSDKNLLASMLHVGNNAIAFQYDTMQYFDSSFTLQKTLTFPASGLDSGSKRYLYSISRLNNTQGFIVFEAGRNYGVFTLSDDDTFYTSVYTGSVGSDGIALNDAAASENVEVLVSGVAHLDNAKQGDIFDSNVSSSKNVYGFSPIDGSIQAIQRSLLIPAGLGAYNFKEIPYEITTTSSSYKIDISSYSTVIVYVTASSREVSLYLNAEISTTVANLLESNVAFSMDSLSSISVYEGKVPFVIYPSLGYIQALSPYRYTGSNAYYTMPWATIADGPISTMAAQEAKGTSGYCYMTIYAS